MASLFVGNLDHLITEELLYNEFAVFGCVTSTRVVYRSPTITYGYVNFDNEEHALRAITEKNNSILNGKVIRVMWSNPDPTARMSGIGNVFVKNLGDAVDSTMLHDMFLQYGNIVSLKLVTFEDGRSKGYGYVQYETTDSANAAIQNLNGSTVEGKQLLVEPFVKKTDRAVLNQASNLYIKNINDGVKDENLLELFSSCGTITSATIMRDEKGFSRGFGFVCFSTPEEANRAIAAYHGYILLGKPLYVALAQKKEERKALQLQYVQRMAGDDGEGITTTILPETGGPTNHCAGNEGPKEFPSILAAASPNDQKQILMEHLHPLVCEIEPDLALRITRMLLESMGTSDLLFYVDSPELLKNLVEETRNRMNSS